VGQLPAQAVSPERGRRPRGAHPAAVRLAPRHLLEGAAGRAGACVIAGRPAPSACLVMRGRRVGRRPTKGFIRRALMPSTVTTMMLLLLLLPMAMLLLMP